jgi:hypothetical protein
MRLRTLAFVLLVASGLVAQERQPTAKECRANLKQWISTFKAAYDDPACSGEGSASCPFAAPIRDLDIGQLGHIPFEAEACAKADKRRRYFYERVAARAENIAVMRAGYFLKSENQMENYIEWEESQRQVSRPSKQSPDNENPTVSRNQ